MTQKKKNAIPPKGSLGTRRKREVPSEDELLAIELNAGDHERTLIGGVDWCENCTQTFGDND